MASQERQPPRFVPTLTEVVSVDDFAGQAADAQPARGPKVVDEVPVAVHQETATFSAPAQYASAPAAMNLTAQQLQSISEQALARVMGRVDVALQERLSYALAEVVQLHTAALYQAMRDEVEQAVRTSVQEAVAEELARQR